MQIKRLEREGDGITDPRDAAWKGVPREAVTLIGVPLGMQPSAYLTVSREQAKVGAVQKVVVGAVHDGRTVSFLLEWQDAQPDLSVTDTGTFPDGAALLFPIGDDAPLITMGAEGHPVEAWHWRADRPGRGICNVAVGLGTTRITSEDLVTANGVWESGRWSVVLSRALQVSSAQGEAAQLRVGAVGKVAFSVWEGSNGERGGLKAFSPEWHSFTLEG
jgi:complex iron-sulfur molybdoenzyme family reductase subunit gamma